MSIASTISIIGTGNVAWHLAVAFKNAGIKIEYIIGRNKDQGKLLAEKVDASYTANSNVELNESSLLLIAVSDSAIEEVSQTIKQQDTVIAHTSGSFPLTVLNGHKNTGVFYPFQTFTKGVNMGNTNFPICIEPSNDEVNKCLNFFANKISKQVVILNSKKRKHLHLSGVLANNFTNHLISRSYDFLEGNNIDNKLLIPILEETIHKLKTAHPKEIQTGPARRGDIEIVKKHLDLLKAHPSLSTIYEVMSNSIISYYA